MTPNAPLTSPAAAPWFVYLIECIGGSIYTGITNNVAARYKAHAAGKGARYTRANKPVRLLCAIKYPCRSSAAKAEYSTKQLTPQQKRDLCRHHSNEYSL